jgi:hypothetical protein
MTSTILTIKDLKINDKRTSAIVEFTYFISTDEEIRLSGNFPISVKSSESLTDLRQVAEKQFRELLTGISQNKVRFD